jgi:serine/threonine-protein kinase
MGADRSGLAPPASRVGTLLHGTYRILEPLAAGGMGEVYLASHERLPGRFAIKMPQRHLRHDQAALSRFHAEAQILAALRHPNIVQVIDFNVAPCGTPYLVMELIEGEDLRRRLRADGPFTPDQVGDIVGQIASALELAHHNGIVHCDLKLENVMLTSAATGEVVVKLLDFGIAQIGCDQADTAHDVIRGTPQFMAPEQIEGHAVDDRADQFALACIAHTLLAGSEPFRAESPLVVLYQVVHAEPEALEQHLEPRYHSVGRVLRRAMAKNPDVRFATILEFARTLQRELANPEMETALAWAA